MKIIKRNGEKVNYNSNKVLSAVGAAMMEVEGFVDADCAKQIERTVRAEVEYNEELGVEAIQDICEMELMTMYPSVAKAYILYRDKKSKERNKEWEMNELQRDVFNSKYRHDNETFNEFIERVSGGNDDIAKLIRNRDFLFGGRILAGRGIDRNVSLANCTTLPPVEDSIEGIFSTAGELARMFSYGQGAGIDISQLRPKGSPVNNASKTSTGAVSFMNIFDTVGEVIGAEGRRSALLIAMDANHDDILDFTKIKDDVEKVTNANISVMMDDEFMKLDTPHKNNVLKEIATGSWRTGEPAILYWDNNKKWHLLSEDEDYIIEGVNACYTGDTLVLTENGNLPIVELIDKPTVIWNGFEWSEVTPKLTNTNQEILDIELSNGVTLSCTPYHEFVTRDNKRVEAKDLTKSDKLMKWKYPVIEGEKSSDKDMYTKGFFSGDGTYQNDKRTRSTIKIYSKKVGIIDYIDYYNKYKNGDGSTVLELDYTKYNNKSFVPSAQYTIKDRLDWLSGILDSDGCVNSECNGLAISSINKEFLSDIQMMLTTLGCHSNLSLMHESGERVMPDGKGGEATYQTKDCYRLNISAYNTKKLVDAGLNTKRLEINANPNRDASRFIHVVNVNKREKLEEKVYCFDEPKNHTGVFNGIMTGQCSEYPTTGYGTCLLGSINLSNYVLNPFTDKARVNTDKLKKDVYNVTIGMNEVLDEAIPTHPLQQQRDVAHNYRQLGIGIMGLADMFIKMGLKYGSDESISEMNHVMTIIRNSTFRSSIDLAKKEGAFPKFNADKVSKSPYFQSLPKDIRNDILKYGIRNSSLLSIAPAGSISLLADCSNGLEPFFAISYTRTTKSLGSVERDYKMYAKVVRELMESKNIVKDDDLPEYCTTAHDVDPLEKIKLQGSLQHYVDLAISSTVNLKEETTVEEIENIYKLAHKEGLKGISVFRDNCFRVGILNTDKEEIEVDMSCPECGGEMIHTGGCEECVECAYSPCSI